MDEWLLLGAPRLYEVLMDRRRQAVINGGAREKGGLCGCVADRWMYGPGECDLWRKGMDEGSGRKRRD